MVPVLTSVPPSTRLPTADASLRDRNFEDMTMLPGDEYIRRACEIEKFRGRGPRPISGGFRDQERTLKREMLTIHQQ